MDVSIPFNLFLNHGGYLERGIFICFKSNVDAKKEEFLFILKLTWMFTKKNFDLF